MGQNDLSIPKLEPENIDATYFATLLFYHSDRSIQLFVKKLFVSFLCFCMCDKFLQNCVVIPVPYVCIYLTHVWPTRCLWMSWNLTVLEQASMLWMTIDPITLSWPDNDISNGQRQLESSGDNSSLDGSRLSLNEIPIILPFFMLWSDSAKERHSWNMNGANYISRRAVR